MRTLVTYQLGPPPWDVLEISRLVLFYCREEAFL